MRGCPCIAAIEMKTSFVHRARKKILTLMEKWKKETCMKCGGLIKMVRYLLCGSGRRSLRSDVEPTVSHWLHQRLLKLKPFGLCRTSLVSPTVIIIKGLRTMLNFNSCCSRYSLYSLKG